MKKAFDQNVSRARPRLRVGALTEAADAAAATLSERESEPVEAQVAAPEVTSAAALGAQVKARVERAREPKPPVVESVQRAIESKPAMVRPSARAEEIVAQATSAVLGTHVPPSAVRAAGAVERHSAPAERHSAPAERLTAQTERSNVQAERSHVQAELVEAAYEEPVRDLPRQARDERIVMHADPPQHLVEVQTPEPEVPVRESPEPDSQSRRERLKERLRAVRENPRPEPLPPSVAEAGVLAVERIATLQADLTRLRALNLALSQDLEGARRQSEKATEEARLRMDESRRLSQEMEGRVKLLQELERELASLEGERDDALLSLQETRQHLDAATKEKDELRAEIAQRDAALSESLLEEERLCTELESAREDASALRRSVDALQSERDTLARQVSELTKERAELLEARKALEAVHRALSQAAAK